MACVCVTLIARLDADDVALPGRIAAQTLIMQADRNSRSSRDGGDGSRGRWGQRRDEGLRRVGEHTPRPSRGVVGREPGLSSRRPMRATPLRPGGYRHGTSQNMTSGWLAGGYGTSVGVPLCGFVTAPRLTRSDTRYRREAFEHLKREWLRPMSWTDPRSRSGGQGRQASAG